MVICFSGIGNSKYIAERIAGSLQEKLLCMNERIKSGNTGSVKTGENLIVVVPTYAWRIPRVVSDWIGQTEFVGAKNVWYVMSCGSGIGGADIYNRKLSEKKGIKHMGTAQIIMSVIWSSVMPKRLPHLPHRNTASSRPLAMMMPYQ